MDPLDESWLGLALLTYCDDVAVGGLDGLLHWLVRGHAQCLMEVIRFGKEKR